MEPWGTVTLAGTMSAGLLLASDTGIAPAAFDRVTVHDALLPTGIFVLAHVIEVRVGVDQRVIMAGPDEFPSVAVSVAVVSLAIGPAAAVNVWVELPAGTIMLAGAGKRAEFELMPMIVAVATISDNVTVHTLCAPDIRPVGEQPNEVIRGSTRLTTAG